MTDCEEVLKEFKELLEKFFHHKHLPKKLSFVYTIGAVSIQVLDKTKEITMQFTGLVPGSMIPVSVVGLNADGSQNPAVLSSQQFTTADGAVATVAVQPDGTGVITLVGTPPTDGTSISTVLTATATATSGTASGTVSGSDTISFTGVTGGVLPTSLGFTYGVPVSPGGVPVPPPVPSPLKKF